MRLICPYCRGTGYITEPKIHDIYKATEWQCGVKRAREKEKELWRPWDVDEVITWDSPDDVADSFHNIFVG